MMHPLKRLGVFCFAMLLGIGPLCAEPLLKEIPFTELTWGKISPDVTLEAREQWVELGWNTSGSTKARMLLAEPIALETSARRLVLRCKGNSGTAKINASVLLKDADGREFSYSIREPLGSRGWQRAETLEMQGELRTSNQGSRSWGDITSEPKRPFTLLGFELTRPNSSGDASLLVRTLEIENAPRDKFPGYWGIFPAAPSIAENYYEFSDQPALHTDRLFSKDGNYRIILTAQQPYNGPVIWSREQQVDYRRSQADSGLPLDFPAGFYWITAKVFDAARGDYLYRRAFMLDVERRTASAVLPKAPQISALEIETESPQGVFNPGDTPAFSIRLPSGVPSGAILEYDIVSYAGEAVGTRQTLPVADNKSLQIRLPQNLIHQDEAYRLDVRLRWNGKLLDESSRLFGYRNPAGTPSSPKPAPTPLNIPGPLHMATCAFWNSANGTHHPIEDIQQLADLAAQRGFSCFSVGVVWPQMEPLPGVYRFEELDQQIQIAKKNGLKVCIEVAGFYEVPGWVHTAANMSDAEGQVHNLWVKPEVSVVPSPSDPFFLKALGSLWQHLAERYGNDPDIIGYTFSGLFADHFYLRNPGPGLTSLGAFQKDLRAKYENSLAKLNKNWGTSYASWEKIPLPEQQADIHHPDFRNSWLDYIDFKNQVFQNYVKTVVESIRSANGKAWIQLYWFGGIDSVQVLDYLKSRGGFAADGGNEQEDADIVRMSSVIPLRNMTEFTESVMQMPLNRFNIDMMFNRLIYGGSGAYFRCLWNLSSAHNETTRTAWMDCIDYLVTDWKPILEQMKDSRPAPLPVGILGGSSQFSDYLRSYEAAQNWPSGGLNSAFLKHHLLPVYIDSHFPLSSLDNYKLLVVNSNAQMLSEAQTDAIVKWTQAGGHLVLCAGAGRWCARTSEKDFVLARRLGVSLAFSGKRLQDKNLSIPATAPFRRKYDLPLYPCGLDGYLGFDAPRAEGKADPLASFSDGTPAILHFASGKGKVLLFLQNIQWSALSAPAGVFSGEDILDDLLAWAGVSRDVSCDQSEFRVAMVRDKEADFLLVHRFMPYGTHSKPTEFNLSQPKLSGTVRLLKQDAGAAYRLTELTRGRHSVLIQTGAELATSGVSLPEMIVGETRVFSLQKENTQ